MRSPLLSTLLMASLLGSHEPMVAPARPRLFELSKAERKRKAKAKAKRKAEKAARRRNR